LYGRFITHAKHGEQFEIAKYELLPPDNEQKIIAFIGGGLIFGVGPVTAYSSNSPTKNFPSWRYR
jgi:ATP-dependent exoDNAse (exonuclease V) alpha subunit